MGGGGKGQENDKELQIWKYIASIQVEDIMICTEAIITFSTYDSIFNNEYNGIQYY
jgi:hypothetical protein